MAHGKGIGQWGDPVITYPHIDCAVIAGGAAGNLTVTGIRPGDNLQVVKNLSAGTDNLASEFTITAPDTINNAGGTNTTGMVLLILWLEAPQEFIGED